MKTVKIKVTEDTWRRSLYSSGKADYCSRCVISIALRDQGVTSAQVCSNSNISDNYFATEVDYGFNDCATPISDKAAEAAHVYDQYCLNSYPGDSTIIDIIQELKKKNLLEFEQEIPVMEAEDAITDIETW